MRVDYTVRGPEHPDLFDGMTPILIHRTEELHAWLVALRPIRPSGRPKDPSEDTDPDFIEVAATTRREAHRLARWLTRDRRLADRSRGRAWRIQVTGHLPREPEPVEIATWQAFRESEGEENQR